MYRDQRLHEVIWEGGVTADVSSYSQVMKGHKYAVRAHKTQPKMNFPQALVHHSTGHLGKPEISASEYAKHSGHAHDHMEMADHEIGGMAHDIDRRLGQEEATDAPRNEHGNEPQCKERSRVNTQLRAIQTEDPDQYHDGGRDGYDQRG